VDTRVDSQELDEVERSISALSFIARLYSYHLCCLLRQAS